jgi:hypothetical protein
MNYLDLDGKKLIGTRRRPRRGHADDEFAREKRRELIDQKEERLGTVHFPNRVQGFVGFA